MIASNELRPGMTFQNKDDIFICMDVSHNKTARAAANIKVKMKNLRTGSVTTTTFGGNEKFKKADIARVEMQLLYKQEDIVVFMNNETFEQIEIPQKQIEWELNFLKKGSVCNIRTFEKEILGIELKPKVSLKIIEAETAVKGDTTTNVEIKVKTDTGFELYTPAFIKKGEVIEISTIDGKYVGRG